MSVVESRREVAERIVRNHSQQWVVVAELRLIEAIEAALKDRDERAAKIAEKEAAEWVVASRNYKALDPMKNSCLSRSEMGTELAAAIRNEDANA